MFEQLRKHRDDRGMMADLRCILVDNKRHRAWPALSRLRIRIDDPILPFVAGLFASHPVETDTGNFGWTCKEIERKRNEKPSDEGKLTPTERRFQHLLASEKDEVQDRIQRMVLMAKSQGVPVNYEQLASDLRYWNDGTKTKWASSYWITNVPSLDEEAL
jgi:CRISPR system Cascade subunit CasB